MPGFIGGIASAVAAATVGPGWSTAAVDESFPARLTRSAIIQGSYQVRGLPREGGKETV
jgi:hypothetical protein